MNSGIRHKFLKDFFFFQQGRKMLNDEKMAFLLGVRVNADNFFFKKKYVSARDSGTKYI